MNPFLDKTPLLTQNKHIVQPGTSNHFLIQKKIHFMVTRSFIYLEITLALGLIVLMCVFFQTAAAAAAGAAATPMHESPLEIEEDDNEVPTLPESSLQPKKISKAPAVKRHLPSMGDSDNESVASSYFSVARNGKKKKKDSDDSEHAFLNIADSVSSIASTFKEGGNHKPVEFGDPHVLWSKTLPSKLHEMDKRVAARFKVHVDTLALDAIDGTWP